MNILSYALIPLMALLLVSAQALWGTAIKKQHLLEGSLHKVIANLISSPRIWLGFVIYACATAVYFLLLSKVKFFSVQVSMTVISVVFSTVLATILFDERITGINMAGLILVLVGLPLVLAR